MIKDIFVELPVHRKANGGKAKPGHTKVTSALEKAWLRQMRSTAHVVPSCAISRLVHVLAAVDR
jgi:hypothetical protein